MIKESLELLGRRAKDKVTTFEGVITTISFDLYGCIQAVLAPPIDKDGKIPEGRWFDVNRLDVSESPAVMPLPDFDSPVPTQPSLLAAAKSLVGGVAAAITPSTWSHGPADKPLN